PALAELLSRMTALDPSARPRAAEVAALLREGLAGALTAPDATSTAPTPRAGLPVIPPAPVALLPDATAPHTPFRVPAAPVPAASTSPSAPVPVAPPVQAAVTAHKPATVKVRSARPTPTPSHTASSSPTVSASSGSTAPPAQTPAGGSDSTSTPAQDPG